MAAAAAAVLAAWVAVVPAGAEEAGFIPKGAADVWGLLPPPPGPQDVRTIQDLNELRVIEATRTPERVAMANADVAETVFRLTIVLDPALTPERLPKTDAFFKKLVEDEEVANDAPKKKFARPRPFVTAPDLRPACALSKSGAFPSGHTTVGYYMGVVLAAMVPERREVIFVRAQEFGESRLVCGVHHRGDIEAGRLVGTALAAFVMGQPQFQAEFADARAELRAALGLAP